ncbi:MAG TPA: bifunctional polysaccharide deacetylase/glycosyltransferase family 2 protein [Jatrophihabitans sp.]
MHWIALAVAIAIVVVLVFVDAVTHSPGGEQPHTTVTGAAAPPPSSVVDGGPVVSSGATAGYRLSPRVAALTFDDGPSPYTAQILDVLERQHVPATFFVIGANIAGHGDELRRMVADGDEVGVHTFTHIDLSGVSAWREEIELDTTQLAIASDTGYLTDLLRLPFSSLTSDMTAGQWQAVQRASGYRTVFADLDTKDWERPGVGRIVAAGTPSRRRGVVIMLHDGGGDRSQTVAALSRLIDRLRARGYRFETVSHAIGVPSPWSRATTGDRWRGTVVLATTVLSRWLVTALAVLFWIAGALAVLRTIVLLIFARRHARQPTVASGTDLPAVSIIVPAYNEGVGIAACVRSLVASDYADFEVIVVDDGSTDDTAAVVRALGESGVRVIVQANAGKPAALMTGIAAARNDVFVLVDGDTVFEPRSLRALVAPMLDPRVGAVSGNTKVGNRRRLLGRWQHVEYVIGFNLDRRMFDVLECMPTVPGAIGAFRRETMADIGGVTDHTLAEDTDLTMAVCRAGWRVVYAPAAKAWTEAPSSIGALWRQRYRWCYGTLQAMWKHRHAIIEHGSSGRLGRRGLPYLMTFQVLLPLLAPVVDAATIAALFTGHGTQLVIAWLIFLGAQIVSAVYAFRLDGERLRVLWVLPLQQIVYRQLMYLVVVQSVASAIYGVRLRWHKLDRTGQLDDAPTFAA